MTHYNCIIIYSVIFSGKVLVGNAGNGKVTFSLG